MKNIFKELINRPNNSNIKHVHMRFQKDLLAKIDKAAAETGNNRTRFITVILKNAILQYEDEKQKHTKESI